MQPLSNADLPNVHSAKPFHKMPNRRVLAALEDLFLFEHANSPTYGVNRANENFQYPLVLTLHAMLWLMFARLVCLDTQNNSEHRRPALLATPIKHRY